MEIVGPLQTPHQRLVITAIREEAPQVKTFFLEAEDRQDIPYQSGQFLTFLFHRLGKEERRSYSMSSSSLPGDPLAITVKRVANGAHSRWLIDAARVGDVLRTTGASGLFTLPADIQRYKQIFLFGAGIGITPLYALLKTILKEHEGIQVVLVYSNRSTADTVFYNELNNLQETYGLKQTSPACPARQMAVPCIIPSIPASSTWGSTVLYLRPYCLPVDDGAIIGRSRHSK